MFNPPGSWRVYVSHVQSEAQAEAVSVATALGAEHCWLDVLMEDCSLPAMEEGMKGSAAFLALLTPSYFASDSQVREFDRVILSPQQQLLLACPSQHDADAILDTAPLSVQVWRAAISAPRPVRVLDFGDAASFAAGIRRLAEELGCPAVDAPAACLGASDLSIAVTSGSGNQYLLMLRIQGDSATMTKQNPDGSVTTFKGRAPTAAGMVRLDGIQASNRGAFIMGQLPDDRGPGQRFTLQANAFANGDQTWECTFTQTLGGTAAAPELATRPVAAAT